MQSRFALAVLVAISSVHISHAQQLVRDVVVSGASLNDGFGNGLTCADGQLYRFGDHSDSVMRVAPDGSTLMFQLPDEQWPIGPSAIAPTATGLDIMSVQRSDARFIGYEMYHFDTQGNLLTQNQVFIDFFPTGVVVMSSGNTMVIGHLQGDPSQRDRRYYGAVLDADDHIIKRFELPLPPGGGGWTPRSRIVAGDRAAYVVLESDRGKLAIATISETGHIDVKIIPVPPDTDQRHHATWLSGPAVAVEVYQYVGEKPPGSLHFDEYDLNTGQEVATKSSPGVGFALACYSRSEFSMLAHSAHADPARHLSPDTLRLVTAKLQ